MPVPEEKRASSQQVWIAIALLWLAGNGLRLTILAVPPVIVMIRDDFSLSATEVGLLSGIPPALFAVAALAGSLLVARFGVREALMGGLVLVAAGSALRGSSTNYAVLFVTTVVMSAGVAIMQPIMPTAVRQWLPHHIGLGTAIYTNGLLVGEIFPTLLTIPYVLPLLSGSWRLSLLFWSLPIAIIAVVIYLFGPRAHGEHAVSRRRGRVARDVDGVVAGPSDFRHRQSRNRERRTHSPPDAHEHDPHLERRVGERQFRAAALVLARFAGQRRASRVVGRDRPGALDAGG